MKSGRVFRVDVDDDGGDHTALESFSKVLMPTLKRELAATISMIWFEEDGWFRLMSEPRAGTKLGQLCKVGLG